MPNNKNKILALCNEGIQHCSEPKATTLFYQVKELMQASDDDTPAPAAKKLAGKKTSSNRKGK